MRLPNGENASVPLAKLTGYLLSRSHPVGGSKARFFHGIGFDEAHAGELARALRAIAASEEMSETVPSRFGTKYIVDGPLDTPLGGRVRVRTVWIVERGDDRPRFVTAYPSRAEREQPHDR